MIDNNKNTIVEEAVGSNREIPTLNKMPEVEETKTSMTIETARAMLKHEAAINSQKCQEELRKPMMMIREILKKYNCAQTFYGQTKSGKWIPVSDVGMFTAIDLVVVSKD